MPHDNPLAIEFLLRYLYTLDTTHGLPSACNVVEINDVFNILTTADKYSLPSLKDAAQTRILELIKETRSSTVGSTIHPCEHSLVMARCAICLMALIRRAYACELSGVEEIRLTLASLLWYDLLSCIMKTDDMTQIMNEYPQLGIDLVNASLDRQKGARGDA